MLLLVFCLQDLKKSHQLFYKFYPYHFYYMDQFLLLDQEEFLHNKKNNLYDIYNLKQLYIIFIKYNGYIKLT